MDKDDSNKALTLKINDEMCDDGYKIYTYCIFKRKLGHIGSQIAMYEWKRQLSYLPDAHD